ncbi:polyadenylate-binding protein-interacting protein 7-like [Actinidia eriantha]|uniref:polyadenylate-binding protein-interacting protein 7-like n=1 Tax=Actinidia eriantha TaxID=165200 RepID=UPI00258F4B0E|nr:polyadenylate-binding protein-interacting protein 7-like [Actinidia eriantha]
MIEWTAREERSSGLQIQWPFRLKREEQRKRKGGVNNSADMGVAASDGNLRNLNSKSLSAPNLSTLDFPAPSVQDDQNGLPKYDGADIHQTVSPYRSTSEDSILLFKSNSSVPTRGSVDFVSAVRKMSSQDLGTRKYDRNGSADASVGSSRSAHMLASTYKGGPGRGIYGDRLQSWSSSRVAPIWLETGAAVANLYSKMRDEARDHVRLRNAYFQQAHQAYLIGHKALAKELSVKGQLHNIQMKAAHGKAQESIYHQSRCLPRSSAISPLDNRARPMANTSQLPNLKGLHREIHSMAEQMRVMNENKNNACLIQLLAAANPPPLAVPSILDIERSYHSSLGR